MFPKHIENFRCWCWKQEVLSHNTYRVNLGMYLYRILAELQINVNLDNFISSLLAIYRDCFQIFVNENIKGNLQQILCAWVVFFSPESLNIISYIHTGLEGTSRGHFIHPLSQGKIRHVNLDRCLSRLSFKNFQLWGFQNLSRQTIPMHHYHYL